MGDPLSQNAYGIDVSHWQGTTPSLVGLDFLFARATIGTQTDDSYATHITAARKAGLVTGAYHFGDVGPSPAAQSKAFLAQAGDVDFYVLDHEGGRRMSNADAIAFVKAVQAAGKRCGLYASLSGYPSFGQDYNWIAYWGTLPPARTWTFWQFGGSGVDHDVYNGSAAELRAFAGKGPINMDIDFNTDPALVDLPADTAILNPDGSGRLQSGPLRTGVISPGTSMSDGGTLLRLIEWTRGTTAAPLLLAVYANAVRNVRPVTPPVGADATPFSQADVNKAADDGNKAGVTAGANAEKARIRSVLGL